MNEIKKTNDELKNFWNDEEKVKKAEEQIKEKIEITILKEVPINEISKNINFNFNTGEEIKIKYKTYSEEDNKEYKPQFLMIQIILNLSLFLCAYYFDSFDFIFIMILNFIITWTYSFISILKNEFKKENNKTVWILALIFIPVITPYVYPDFKDIQTI